MPRDDKLREEMGIYEKLMDDAGDLANIFIGNETMFDYSEGGDFVPFLKLLAEFHFSPENDRIYTELKHRVNLIKKLVLDLSTNIDANYKKGKFLYRNRG